MVLSLRLVNNYKNYWFIMQTQNWKFVLKFCESHNLYFFHLFVGVWLLLRSMRQTNSVHSVGNLIEFASMCLKPMLVDDVPSIVYLNLSAKLMSQIAYEAEKIGTLLLKSEEKIHQNRQEYNGRPVKKKRI